MSMWMIGIATAVSVIGTGVSVYAQQQAADAAETTATINANEQRRQASAEAEVAAENARRAEQEKARYLATQRAQLAASGLAMEGTPLAVLGETAAALEMEVLDIGHAAAARQRALRIGAQNTLFEGANTASALRLQSVATGISGLGDAAGGYIKASGSLAQKTTTPTG